MQVDEPNEEKLHMDLKIKDPRVSCKPKSNCLRATQKKITAVLIKVASR